MCITTPTNECHFLAVIFQVSDKGSLTAEEFAKLLGLSVLLSKERYADTEAHIALTAPFLCQFKHADNRLLFSFSHLQAAAG